MLVAAITLMMDVKRKKRLLDLTGFCFRDPVLSELICSAVV